VEEWQMLIEFNGKRPRIAEAGYVAPNAVIRGDVRIGPGTTVLFGAVITDEGGSIEIGADCVIMENAVLRGTPKNPLRIGNRVLVGPHAHVTGCHVEDDCFVATGSSIFNGARLESGVEVRINGVVHVNTRVARDSVVPIGWIAVGDPAEIRPPDDHGAIWEVQQQLDFPGTVWGTDRTVPQGESTKRFARGLARHKRDRVVEEQPE
jgi:carbonic anhydrase/acetyltransferase-like protein (isoleucine patch superfamily)